MLRSLPEQKLTYFHITLLCLTPFLVFWPLWLHAEAMAYDMADYFLPFRYFIGECLQQHRFPWWNPYSGLGIPMTADPQSGVFYPVTWCIGYLFGYDFITINIEYVLHLTIAGCGMYQLLRGMKYAPVVCLLMAASYQFSGFFINNAQHLTWIISASWLPFFLHYYRLTILFGKRNNAIKAALSLFMFTTGGYPAFLIILLYLVGGHFIFMLLQHILLKKPSEILHMLKWSSMMLLIYLVVTAPYILSFIEGIPLMTRGEALPKEHTLFRAFTPQSAITFLLPAAPLGQHIDFETDTSMANAYIGLLALVFFLTGIFNKHSRETLSIIIIALLLLLFSFGDALPFWSLLFEQVPLFDHIRFPAAFRLFAIIGFIIAAAEGLNNKRILQSALPRYLAIFILLLVFTISVVSFFLVSKLVLPVSFTTESMLRFFGESNTLNNIFLQSIIQVVLLVLLLLLLNSGQKKVTGKWYILLVIFVFADLFIAARINFPVIIGSAFPAKQLNEKLSQTPAGFPLWDPNTETEVTNIGNGSFAPSYFNNNLFLKKFARDSYAPFILKLRNELEQSPADFALMDHPVIYLTNQLQPFPLNSKDKVHLLTKKSALATGQVVKQFENPAADSLSADIQMVSFSPSNFTVNTIANQQAALVLQQTYYPGWKVKVDGVVTDPTIVNYCMMAVILQAGKHQVSYFYDTIILEKVLLASTCILILLVGLLFFDSLRISRRNRLNLRP